MRCWTWPAAAVGTAGPFTIGVFADWGQGKTSALRLARAIIDDDETLGNEMRNSGGREEAVFTRVIRCEIRSREDIMQVMP